MTSRLRSRMVSGLLLLALCIWDTSTGSCVTTWGDQRKALREVAFSVDASYNRYQDDDGNVYRRDSATGKLAEVADEDESVHHSDCEFEIQDHSRLVRMDGDGSKHLVCFLPLGTMARGMASCKLAAGTKLVAIRCLNGDLSILEYRRIRISADFVTDLINTLNVMHFALRFLFGLIATCTG